MLCSNLNWFVSISVATLEFIKDYIIVSKTKWNVSVHCCYHLRLRETFRLALLPNVSSWIKISCCLGTWLVFINSYCNFFGRISRIQTLALLHNFLFLWTNFWPCGSMGALEAYTLLILFENKQIKLQCFFLIYVVLFKFEVYCLLISYYRNLILIFITSSIVL